MAAHSFDLIERRWLPVRIDGVPATVGLRDLFLQAHEVTDVDVGLPPAASGLWRLLTVLAARVTGLDAAGRGGVESWHARREELLNVGAFDRNMIDTYFERYRDRFDLFHPQRPWLQDPRLAEECSKSSGLN
ncbi:MAG: CRISPR-associated protein Cse1 family, partial [Gemmatimonadales bacterium]|nr:CRISPR-associated protein Cse1 family [Gemmatimonadales bacterium]